MRRSRGPDVEYILFCSVIITIFLVVLLLEIGPSILFVKWLFQGR